MGVDLSTHRGRIGTFVNCGVFKSVQHGVILNENCSSAKFRIGLAGYTVLEPQRAEHVAHALPTHLTEKDQHTAVYLEPWAPQQ